MQIRPHTIVSIQRYNCYQKKAYNKRNTNEDSHVIESFLYNEKEEKPDRYPVGVGLSPECAVPPPRKSQLHEGVLWSSEQLRCTACCSPREKGTVYNQRHDEENGSPYFTPVIKIFLTVQNVWRSTIVPVQPIQYTAFVIAYQWAKMPVFFYFTMEKTLQDKRVTQRMVIYP